MTEIDVPDWVAAVALEACGEHFTGSDDDMRSALTAASVSERARIIAMLVEVARAAHYAMDDCGDLLLTEDGAEKLSNALDALDELPEIDDGYVRDGWCKAKDWLIALNAYTTPQPSADAVRELVKRWRDLSDESAEKATLIAAGNAVAYQSCADELESLLSAASGEKGVG